MRSFSAKTGGSVQSRKSSLPVFSGLVVCNLIFQGTVVPSAIDNVSFFIMLYLSEVKSNTIFTSVGIQCQWDGKIWIEQNGASH